MNILLDKESYRLYDNRIVTKRTKKYRYQIIEITSDTSEGRLIATVDKKEDAVAICIAMGWKIVDDHT